MCGVGIKEFAIGMGPKIFSKKSKKYDTEYSLRAFPIGGYVSMVGEDEENDSEDSFNQKPLWKRLLIIIAGPMMNILLSILIMFVLVISSKSLISNVIYSFDDDALSQSCGLQAKDRIIKVENVPIHTGNELIYEIMHRGYKPLNLTVERNGDIILLDDVVFPAISESGTVFGEPDFKLYSESPTFSNLIKHSFYRSVSTIKMIWDSIIDLVVGRYGFEAVSGPVGVTETIGDAAASGFYNLVYIVVVISMNLGIFNLLPFPALDGGRLIFLIFEAIRRKPLNRDVEGMINFIGLIILFGIMIVVTFKDIITLFR